MKIASEKEQRRSIFWIFVMGLSVFGLISQSFGQEPGLRKFGNYYIGQDFSEIRTELSEISSAEYAAMRTFPKNGKMYHGKEIGYLYEKWTTTLGVRENKIYELRLQTGYDERDVWHLAFHDLIKEYGFSPDQKTEGQSFVTTWDTGWGSVVLNRTITKSQKVVEITLTESHPSRKLSKAPTERSPQRILPKTQGQPQRTMDPGQPERAPSSGSSISEPSVNSLIGALRNDPNPEIRVSAGRKLGDLMDKQAVKPLCEALTDPFSNVRVQVVYALGALSEIDDAAIECLTAALKDEGIRGIAGDLLIRMGGPAVKTLTEALNDPEMKERAIDLLGSVGKGATPSGKPIKAEGDVIEPISSALKDERAAIRGRAARELGEIKDARAVDPLSAALNDPDETVRGDAAAALGKIGRPALEALIAALRNSRADVRMNAANALGQIRDERAVEPLGTILTDQDPIVRGYASEALAKMGEPASERLTAKFIKGLKDQDPSKRAEAAEALAGIGDVRAVEPLMIALKDHDQRVRMNAALTLGKIKDARAAEPLIRVLSDPVGEVQTYAMLALVQIGNPLLEPLILALNDPDPTIRYRAAKALGAIKDFRAVEPLIRAMKNHWGLPYQEAGRALSNITGQHFGNRPEEWQKWWDQVKEKHLENVKR